MIPCSRIKSSTADTSPDAPDSSDVAVSACSVSLVALLGPLLPPPRRQPASTVPTPTTEIPAIRSLRLRLTLCPFHQQRFQDFRLPIAIDDANPIGNRQSKIGNVDITLDSTLD